MEQDKGFENLNYSANIPSDNVSGDNLMYYFFAEDVYGNQSLYPELGYEQPLLVTINNTLDDNTYHNIETNLLAPTDGSKINRVPIIIISLYNELGEIDLDSHFLVFIINKLSLLQAASSMITSRN